MSYLVYWLDVEKNYTEEELKGLDFDGARAVVMFNAEDVDKMQEVLWYLSHSGRCDVVAVWHPDIREGWVIFSNDEAYEEGKKVENLMEWDDAIGVNIPLFPVGRTGW